MPFQIKCTMVGSTKDTNNATVVSIIRLIIPPNMNTMLINASSLNNMSNL